MVEFDPRMVDPRTFRQAVAFAKPVEPPRPRHPAPPEPGYGGALARLAFSGAVLAGLLSHRLLTGAVLFAGTPLLSVGSLTTLLAGYPIFRRGFGALLTRRHATMDTLISTATFTSLLLRESLTGLIVVWLINVGDLLEGLTLRSSRRAIRDLLTTGDDWVWVLVQGVEVRVALDEVTVGDHVMVHEGEKIPVDGAVVAGEAAVNQSAITGEPLPVNRSGGDHVFAGTIVEAGHLVVDASAVGDDTAVGRIILQVEEAHRHRAHLQTAADEFSEHIVPWSLGLSALVFLLTRDVNRSLSMLVIACPCAAGLSTPTAFGAAIGNAAGRGILVKGGLYLETAGQVDALIFDKTGTLTTGVPRVAEVVACHPNATADAVLRLAAAAERHAHHPFAAAVQRAATARGIVSPPATDYETLVALGVQARVEGATVTVGGKRLMERMGLTLPEIPEAPEESILWVARDARLVGYVGVTEEIRPEAHPAIEELRTDGLRRIVVASGDRGAAAAHIASLVGVPEFRAGLLPDDKLDLVHELQANGHRVAMVGDGINDAPALAAADLGIAMGTAGTDVAVEAADIALAGDDLRQIPGVIRLGRHTLDVIHVNYAAAIGVNALGIGLSAFGLMSPMVGALIHNLSTIAVVLHSARLVVYRDRSRLVGRRKRSRRQTPPPGPSA
jgi:cation-transporting P-type ATPase C